MTEKRFILIDGVKKGTPSGIWDNLKQNNQRVGDELWVGEVVAMLNEGIVIVEENEQLKLQNQRLDIDIKNNQLAYYDLEKENEQLKKRLAEREKMLDVRDKIIGDVSKALNGGLE